MNPYPRKLLARLRSQIRAVGESRRERYRKGLVLLTPVLLCLPFAADITRALPPLTMTLYLEEDGSRYLLHNQQRYDLQAASGPQNQTSDDNTVAELNPQPDLSANAAQADVSSSHEMAVDLPGPISDAVWHNISATAPEIAVPLAAGPQPKQPGIIYSHPTLTAQQSVQGRAIAKPAIIALDNSLPATLSKEMASELAGVPAEALKNKSSDKSTLKLLLGQPLAALDTGSNKQPPASTLLNLGNSYDFSTRLDSHTQAATPDVTQISDVVSSAVDLSTSDLLATWQTQNTRAALLPVEDGDKRAIAKKPTRTLIFTGDHSDRPLVIIDPGHGGSDPGTVGSAGLLEKDLTLDVAKRLMALAADDGSINIRLTRDQDEGMSRQRRLSAVNRQEPDLLLSLHFNNLPQKDVAVVETFYADIGNILESRQISASEFANAHSNKKGQKRDPNAVTKRLADHKPVNFSFEVIERAKQSKLLAGIVQRHLFNTVSQHDKSVQNNGTKSDTLFMLTQSRIPGALVELSCLSHPDEEERLHDDNYKNQLAQSLLDALLEYVQESQTSPAV